MEDDTDDFDNLVLNTFSKTKLYRASDTPGRGWNTYGGISGIIRTGTIKSGDYQGWGVMTFHNQRTGALGLNILIVPNFVMDHSIREPSRLTFKALSRTLGNNGMQNMYSLKLASSEDAARLCYAIFVLQLAAKKARAGSPIAIPSPVSVEATVARAFIGTDQDEVDRQFVRSRLCQLAEANRASFSSMNNRQWSESFFAAPVGQDEVQELVRIREDERSVNGSLVSEEVSTSDVAVVAQVTRDESDGSESLRSNSDFVESQDWFAAFAPRH